MVGITEAARLLGISASYLRQLADQGVISTATTPGGHRRFDVELLLAEWDAFRAGRETELWSKAFPLDALDEHAVWVQLAEALPDDLTAEARSILGYAVTEMVNNAIDHSRGSRVEVTASLLGGDVVVHVDDDGIGAFRSIADGLSLPGPGAALVEITKGKRTTDPTRHSGEGLFFTSKAVDSFAISANGYTAAFDNRIGDVAGGSNRIDVGTHIAMRLDRGTERKLAEVFGRFAPVEEGGVGGFVRTIPRIELIERGGDFISRSEAKRFAVGLEQFEEVDLDFTGLELIGQGFADELFRVWQREHPEVRLNVVGASRGVRLMIDRVGG